MSIFPSIEEWGKITLPKDLDSALEAFVTARRTPTDPRHAEAANAAGLTIPPAANADWILSPISPQDSYRIIDLRAGTTFLNVPLVQGRPTKSGNYPFAATSVIGTVVEHQPAPTAGAPAAAVVLQRVIHGGSSTSCQLVRPVTKDRWYPKAMEGISPGQALHVESGENTWGVIVADVGWDPHPPDPDPNPAPTHPQPLPYFTIADHAPPGGFPLPPPKSFPLPVDTRIQRKTAIGGLTVIGEDHTLNQQSAFTAAKYAYGDGDALCAIFSFNYQGDFVSAGGDEGGVGAATDLIQDLKLFSGTVESFTQEVVGSGTDQHQAWVLTHQAQSHLNLERLAAGRPIINLNQGKWIEGACRVWDSTTYPTKTADINITTGVVEVPGATLPPEVVGRFLSINEPSEYIDPTDSFSMSSGLIPARRIRRWFQITHLQSDPIRGSQLLQVRFKLADAYQGVIQLVDPGHFSFAAPGGVGDKDVKFIIAPGGIPYDVSRAVAQDDNGNPPHLPRKILMQPNADTDAKPRDLKYPFGATDPVEQALGSRSVNPTGFRVRHRTSWPTQSMGYPDVSFYAQNGGAAQVGIGLMIQGAGRTRLADDKSRFRGPGGAAYDTGVLIQATTRTAIRVQGEVEPPHGVNLPPGQPVAGVALHMDQTGGSAARKVIGWTNDPPPGTKTPVGLTTIGYDPASGSFQIVGAETVKIVGAKTFDLGGAKISGVAPSAGLPTLQGTVSVPPAQPAAQGSTHPRVVAATARVTFPSPVSGDYIAMVAPGWMTGFGVAKRQDGFTVTFDTAPPAAPPGQSAQETFDWIVYR
jgi:hypothetical protein